ncbi:MAG: tyrosine-type recombinase/integrase [Acidobacteriia bacterium]|nr:tyrosine-type recombinase/integrase [Terriglobia bacterium]
MEIGLIQRMLRKYRLWDSIAPDVHMLSERKDIGRALTADEEQRLLEATAKTDSACHTAIVLALNTAMRKDEIRQLRWAQIDWQQRTVTVGKSKTSAGTGRVIPLNASALHGLAEWARRFPMQSRSIMSSLLVRIRGTTPPSPQKAGAPLGGLL